MFLVFIIIAVVVLILIKSTRTPNNGSSNTASRPQNQYPQWTANQNRPDNANSNPMLDSHLCDDGQHDGQNVSFNSFIDNINNETTAMPASFRGAVLTKQEKAQKTEELKDLLEAGIITPEEYYQRKREL